MNLRLKALFLYGFSIIVLAAVLFIPAGTLDYWQAWLYLALLFAAVAIVGGYLAVFEPEFLERRLRTREKEKTQMIIQLLGVPLFIAGFVLPGLDRRFGWSNVPAEWSIAADAIVLIGYAIVFWVFRTNAYAGRTIMVEKGQKVVSTGPYAIVRHPMYAGTILMLLATPVALGSFVALIPFILYIPVLAMRIRNEEEVLCRELSGYKKYMKKARFRLVPGIW